MKIVRTIRRIFVGSIWYIDFALHSPYPSSQFVETAQKMAFSKALINAASRSQRIFSTASSTRSTAMISMPAIFSLGALALGMMA
jgi:hypothetical protein